MRFSYDISNSSVSLNLMQISSKNVSSFKDFQSDQIQTSSRKLFTAHYAVTGTTNGFIFQIINSLIESWGVRLTCFDCKHYFMIEYNISKWYNCRIRIPSDN